jgi:hypothetical protein
MTVEKAATGESALRDEKPAILRFLARIVAFSRHHKSRQEP